MTTNKEYITINIDSLSQSGSNVWPICKTAGQMFSYKGNAGKCNHREILMLIRET